MTSHDLLSPDCMLILTSVFDNDDIFHLICFIDKKGISLNSHEVPIEFEIEAVRILAFLVKDIKKSPFFSKFGGGLDPDESAV